MALFFKWQILKILRPLTCTLFGIEGVGVYVRNSVKIFNTIESTFFCFQFPTVDDYECELRMGCWLSVTFYFLSFVSRMCIVYLCHLSFNKRQPSFSFCLDGVLFCVCCLGIPVKQESLKMHPPARMSFLWLPSCLLFPAKWTLLFLSSPKLHSRLASAFRYRSYF